MVLWVGGAGGGPAGLQTRPFPPGPQCPHLGKGSNPTPRCRCRATAASWASAGASGRGRPRRGASTGETSRRRSRPKRARARTPTSSGEGSGPGCSGGQTQARRGAGPACLRGLVWVTLSLLPGSEPWNWVPGPARSAEGVGKSGPGCRATAGGLLGGGARACCTRPCPAPLSWCPLPPGQCLGPGTQLTRPPPTRLPPSHPHPRHPVPSTPAAPSCSPCTSVEGPVPLQGPSPLFLRGSAHHLQAALQDTQAGLSALL